MVVQLASQQRARSDSDPSVLYASFPVLCVRLDCCGAGWMELGFVSRQGCCTEVTAWLATQTCFAALFDPTPTTPGFLLAAATGP